MSDVDWPAVDILFDRLTPRGRVLLTADHAGVLCLIDAITLAVQAGTVFTDPKPWLDLQDRLTALFAPVPA